MTVWAGYLSAGLTLLWALVHFFVGSPETAGPILASGLPEVTRGTAVLVWHFMTALLVVMAGALAWASLSRNRQVMVYAILQASALVVVGLALPPLLGVGYAVLPQGWLFVPVAALGLWALRG